MVGDNACSPSSVLRSGNAVGDFKSLILCPKSNDQFSMPRICSPVSPVFHSHLLPSSSAFRLPLGLAFSSSAGPPQGSTPTPKISPHLHKLPPPVNPPETVNPDPATLREQWKYATRLYSRWYGHAWGTAILAGASFFALGWLIKGGNPVTGSQKKEEKKEER